MCTPVMDWCLCTSKIHMLKPQLPIWLYLEWRLWEVIRLWPWSPPERIEFFATFIISALIRRDSREMISSSAVWGYSKKGPFANQDKACIMHWLLVSWSWTYQPPELLEIIVCYLSQWVCGIFGIASQTDKITIIVTYHLYFLNLFF